ncbi:Gfo/Idh/MocA family protein [Opitutus terrae]|uniref:Oxidoreductase domain protein n=1 Tax=Opitutus terrae (strain DSM 11246 / JCM 15787 / PB90-1) TaxID=452637 RepID=B1ZT72_OPITP|nr:Gfo/Idh/MocA family oxidoreductase [Opitutus terrae]ACB76526.1 oxidoreductase domain protein [Opitutus terrae PB90-1]
MAAPSPLRVILVGCGAVARQFYVPALRGLQNIGWLRVVAIVDPAVAAREIVARAFPKASQAAALEHTTSPAGTLAIIVSPPAFHAAQAIAALERGWHVLVEKPLAASVAECEQMIDTARRQERLLAAGLHHRFFPASRYLRALCRDWLLGPLISFRIREGGPFRSPVGPSFFDRTQTPGGVLFDLGIPVFDLLGWWLGEPDNVRYADDSMGGFEANAFAELHYPGGAVGRVHLSRDWPTAQEYRFVFERGVVGWPANDASALSVQLAGAPAAVQGALVPPLSELPPAAPMRPLEGAAQCFVLQLANVLRAVAGEEPLAVPATEGVAALRLLEHCYATRTLVAQPWLSREEAQPALDHRASLRVLP